MLDPVRPPGTALFAITKPWADKVSLPTLPHHIHEVLFALVLYQGTQSVLSPLISNALFPNIYPKLNRRTRINWDVHVVSMVQSCLINSLALWVMFTDEERSQMGTSVVERVYGYTGASGLIQGLACGYFLWDLVVSTRYIRIFGLGIWAHAVTAFFVFSFGFVRLFFLSLPRRTGLTLNLSSSGLSATTTGPSSSCTSFPVHSLMCTGSATNLT